MSTIHKKSLAYGDAQSTHVLYSIPLGELLQMDKNRHHRFINQIILVCRWLEDTLKPDDELDRKGE